MMNINNRYLMGHLVERPQNLENYLLWGSLAQDFGL